MGATMILFLLFWPMLSQALRLAELNAPPSDAIQPRKLEGRAVPLEPDTKEPNNTVEEEKKDIAMMPRNHTVNWGKRSLPSMCPKDMFIWGYKLVYDSNRWVSVGLNRVDFYCRGVDLVQFHLSETVKITTNFNVSYRYSSDTSSFWQEENYNCESHNGPMTRIFMQYQDLKQAGVVDQGVLNFQGICWDNRTLPVANRYPEISGYQSINGTGECQQGYAICGYSATYQAAAASDAVSWDGSNVVKGVADLNFYCCKVPYEVDTCNLNQEYRVVARVDNRNNPNATKETYKITSRITVTETTKKEEQTSWERSRTEGFTEQFIINSLKEKSHSERENKFEREQSLLGMVQGFFDVVSGLTGFIKKGVGKLLGSSGLGKLFEVPSIGKLTGTLGMKNAVGLGKEAITKFFSNSNFGKVILKNNVGSLIADLNDVTEDKKLTNIWGFHGYGKTLESYNRFVSRWSPSANPEEMNTVMGPAVTIFFDMSFSDIMGVYGLTTMFGKKHVNGMLRSGQLGKFFRLGSLERKSWGMGIGQIVDSDNIGKLYNTFSLMSVFGPFGFGQIVDLEKLVGVNDGKALSDRAFTPFKSRQGFNQTHFEDICVIASLAQLIGKESALLPSMLKGSALEDLLGNDALPAVLENGNLEEWIQSLESLAGKTDDIKKYQALHGVGHLMEKMGTIIGSEDFQNAIGNTNYQLLIGSADVNNSADVTKLGYFYALKEILGYENLPITELGSLAVDEVESLLTKRSLGTVLGVYSVGQIMSLKSLETVTGPSPPKLRTLDGSHLKKRGLFDGLGKAVKEGFTAFIGGILPNLLGEPEAPNRIKNSVLNKERESLEEERRRETEEEYTEKESFGNTLIEEAIKINDSTTIENVQNVYAGGSLTLVLSPTINCDQYYAMDITSPRRFFTIIVPNNAKCVPSITYVVVDSFDCLSTEKNTNRSFFMEVGSEWDGMGQFKGIQSNVKDILGHSETTAGVVQKVQAYTSSLLGMENLGLKQVLEKDLKVKQVWKEMEAYEGVIEAWQFNFNIVLQLKLTCKSVTVYSSIPQRIRFPRVFRCKTNGVWIQLYSNNPENRVHNFTIGLVKGGKDVNSLSPLQRSIPAVTEQLHRMANELHDLFSNAATSPSNLDDVNWKSDASLSRNVAWTKAEPTPHVVDVPSDPALGQLFQLHAHCGPVVVAMSKFKIVKDGTTISKFPPDMIEDAVDNDECPDHMGCEALNATSNAN